MRNALSKIPVPLHNLHAGNSCVSASHGLNLSRDWIDGHPEIQRTLESRHITVSRCWLVLRHARPGAVLVFRGRRGLVVGKRQDHVRPNPELEVDLATATAIGPAAIGAIVGRWPAPLSLAAVQDDLDVGVVSESFEQVLVEAHIAARDEEQMSGHASLDHRSGLSVSSCRSH
jgi:hypothetical protein